MGIGREHDPDGRGRIRDVVEETTSSVCASRSAETRRHMPQASSLWRSFMRDGLIGSREIKREQAALRCMAGGLDCRPRIERVVRFRSGTDAQESRSP